MNLLIDCAKNTLEPFRAFIESDKNNTVIIVTESPKKDWKFIKETAPENSRIIPYSELDTLLQSTPLMPDLAIGQDVRRLLRFRNQHAHFFPVIGMLYGLGSLADIESLQDIITRINYADHLICHDENTQALAVKLGVQKSQISVVANGLNLTQYKPVKYKDALRKKLGIPEGKVVITLLAKQKLGQKLDVTPFIRILPELKQEIPNSLLYIVGKVTDKPYVDGIKALLKQQKTAAMVKWNHKPDAHPDRAYFQSADVTLFLPDFSQENYRLDVIKAMACESPVMLPNFAGYKGLIADKKEGLLIPSMTAETELNPSFYYEGKQAFERQYAESIVIDYHAVIQTMVKRFQSEKELKKMGKAVRDLVSRKHCVKQQQEVYLKQIKLCINKSKEGQEKWQPSARSVYEKLAHQTTYQLTDSDELTASTLSKEELNVVRLRPLALEIMTCLSKSNQSIKLLSKQINTEKQAVVTQCLYLLKQGFIRRG